MREAIMEATQEAVVPIEARNERRRSRYQTPLISREDALAAMIPALRPGKLTANPFKATVLEPGAEDQISRDRE